jgi:lipid II isoglutaminyl synthase (glutamine-hydrolysing)
MATIRLIAAILCGKLVYMAVRLRGGGGSALPGLVALRIDPQLVRKLSSQATEGTLLVTGTNGKTTSARMLATILEKSGRRVVRNEGGSNLLRGVASALLRAASASGKISAEFCLFEVDEASLPAVARQTGPRLIMVTNLFRDQLDRYGELISTATLIDSALKSQNGATLILNGDDPLVASLGSPKQQRLFWGIRSGAAAEIDEDEPMDSIDCPVCGKRLIYASRSYAHLGDYRCPDGHICRPPLALSADLRLHGLKGTSLTLSGGGEVMLSLPGLFNASNALGALLASDTLGLPRSDASESLETVQAAFGRLEAITIDNRRVYLLLIKNPTGFTQVIDLIRSEPRGGNLLLALNDNFADGTDVSWIWDASLERLRTVISRVTVSGIRAEDMLLRLKYAGFDLGQIKLEHDLQAALADAVRMTPTGETLFVLPTYTAMLSLRKILAAQGRIAHFLETT